VAVGFSVIVASPAAAASVSSGITAVAANPDAFAATLSSSLQQAGVDVVVTVAVSQPISVINAPPVNMSAITNISAATTQVTSQLANLTGSALATAQTSLLDSLSSANANASSSDVSNMVALVLAVVGTGGNISAAVQSSALAALDSLFSGDASASTNLSSAASASLLNTMTVLITDGGGTLSASSVSSALSVMIVVTSSGVLSASGTDNAASVMASVVSSANLSDPSVSNSVLNVLGSVATGSISLTGDASSNIVGALSSVAGSSSSGAAPSAAALTAVSGVLSSLATSQAAALVASLASGAVPAPLVVSSPSIKACVQLHVSDGSTPLELAAVPGSASAFAPIDASLLPSGSPAVAKFHALTFDPYGGNATTGSTRLQFSSANGSALTVANATAPILFTLPHVPLVGETQASCSWFDHAAGNYSTSGCVGVPSPQPPGHTLAFIPGYTTPDDASLASAWSISGPLFPPGACQVQVLDCGSDAPCSGAVWGRNCSVYPNPRSPLLFPAVTCPGGGGANGTTNATANSTDNSTAVPAPVLRVIYGASCPLWQPNALNCSWCAPISPAHTNAQR